MKNKLYDLQDVSYREFHCKLIPNIAAERVIGVRTPALRSLAKDIFNSKEAECFLRELPHYYYEENNLHAFLIAQIKDFDECIKELNRFLPYVDNWATCDMLRPKALSRRPDKLLCEIFKWLKSQHEYTVRFAIEMLMLHFLKENFKAKYMDLVAQIHSDKYYINMMIAWYFAEALVWQYETAVNILKSGCLSVWCHNKSIQKACESFRITAEQKEYLKGLKRK